MAVDPVRDAGGRLSPGAAAAHVAELFDRHGRMVYAVCRLLLRDRVEAQDAAQETFLSAHQSILGGTEPRDPPAWLGTIARNECRSRIRARMGEPLLVLREDERSPGDLEHLAVQREEVEALCAALAELPPTQRDAVVLREFYGLSYEEVSAALGVTGPAVDSLLVRARRRLQETLRPARVASGMLVVPVALRDSLAEALPGFVPSSGAGMLAKVAALPLAAKLAGAAATVAVVGTIGYRHPDVLPPAPEPVRAESPVERQASPSKEEDVVPAVVLLAAEPVEREERDDRSGPGGGERDEDDDERDDEPERRDRSGSGGGGGEAEEPEEEDRSDESSGSDSGGSDSSGSSDSGSEETDD